MSTKPPWLALLCDWQIWLIRECREPPICQSHHCVTKQFKLKSKISCSFGKTFESALCKLLKQTTSRAIAIGIRYEVMDEPDPDMACFNYVVRVL